MSQKYRTIQYNYCGGLLSPTAEGAVNTAAYQNGLAVAENVFYGQAAAIFKRNGTRFGCVSKSGSALYKFNVDGESYAVEFYNYGARLLSEIGEVIGSEVTTPYALADVSSLVCTSNMGVLYITHRNYKPATMQLNSSGQLQAPVYVSFVQSQTATATSSTNRTICKVFDTAGNYPAINAFYGGRWYLYSTKNDPLMMWASRTYDSASSSYRYNDFTLQEFEYQSDGSGGGQEVDVTVADHAFAYLSSNMYGSEIKWIYVHQAMLVATSKTIFKDGGSPAVTATTDNPFSLSTATDFGSNGEQAVAIGSYVFFAGSDRRALYCIAYNQEYSSYSGADVSAAVSQYLRNGIKRIIAINSIIPSVWVLTEDGNLLVLYFEAGSIAAWSVMTFSDDDYPEWIEDIQGSNDGQAYVMLRMNRAGSSFIETLKIVSPANLWEEPHLDSYIAGSAAHLTGREITGLNIYESETENIHKYIGYDINDDRSRELDGYTYTAYQGLAYSTIIGTLRSELPANGTSQSTIRSVSGVVLRLYRSLGGSIQIRPDDLDYSEDLFIKDTYKDAAEEMLYRIFGVDQYGDAYRLLTGDKEISFRASSINDDRLLISSHDPFPFCVCALIVNHAITEV